MEGIKTNFHNILNLLLIFKCTAKGQKAEPFVLNSNFLEEYLFEPVPLMPFLGIYQLKFLEFP